MPKLSVPGASSCTWYDLVKAPYAVILYERRKTTFGDQSTLADAQVTLLI